MKNNKNFKKIGKDGKLYQSLKVGKESVVFPRKKLDQGMHGKKLNKNLSRVLGLRHILYKQSDQVISEKVKILKIKPKTDSALDV